MEYLFQKCSFALENAVLLQRPGEKDHCYESRCAEGKCGYSTPDAGPAQGKRLATAEGHRCQRDCQQQHQRRHMPVAQSP